MVREACDGLISAVKFRLQARNAMGHSCWSAWSESSTRGTENARFHAGGTDNPEHQNPDNPECLEVESPNLNALGIHFTCFTGTKGTNADVQSRAAQPQRARYSVYLLYWYKKKYKY